MTMKKKIILIIAGTIALLLVLTLILSLTMCNLRKKPAIEELSSLPTSSEETTSIEESSEPESTEAESSAQASSTSPSSAAAASSKAASSSKAQSVAASIAPSQAQSTAPPADPNPNWNFKEGVTYEQVLRPHAQTKGYSCNGFWNSRGYYCMSFKKGGYEVYVEALTASKATELGFDSSRTYKVMWGTEERVQQLKSTLRAPGEIDFSSNSSFIIGKLS